MTLEQIQAIRAKCNRLPENPHLAVPTAKEVEELCKIAEIALATLKEPEVGISHMSYRLMWFNLTNCLRVVAGEEFLEEFEKE